MSSWRTSDTRKQAGARLRPGNFQGTAPRRRSHEAEEAVIHSMEGQWFTSTRYRRRARVTSGEVLTATGTVRLGSR